jgi:hypothetical protein
MTRRWPGATRPPFLIKNDPAFDVAMIAIGGRSPDAVVYALAEAGLGFFQIVHGSRLRVARHRPGRVAGYRCVTATTAGISRRHRQDRGDLWYRRSS